VLGRIELSTAAVKPMPAGMRSGTEYVPWESEQLPGFVCCKDLSIMVLFQYEGADIDGAEQYQVDAFADKLERAISKIDSEVCVFTGAFRRLSNEYPAGTFLDPYAEKTDDVWRQELESSGQFSNRYYIAFTLASRFAKGSILNRVGSQLKGGKNPVAALTATMTAMFSEPKLEELFQQDFAQEAGRLMNVALSTLGAAPYIKATHLQGEALRSALKMMVCPASDFQGVAQPRLDLLLDSLLPDNFLHLVDNYMVFRGPSATKYAAVISVKEWPLSTEPGMLDDLLKLPIELSVTQTFKGLDQEKAKSYIEGSRRYNQSRRFNLIQMGVAKLFGNELTEEDEDQGRNHNVAEANTALAEMRSESRHYGYFNMTIMVIASSVEELNESVTKVVKLITNENYVCVRESIGLLSGFKATIPGAHDEAVRWHFAHAGHVSDLAFARTIGQGTRVSPYFSDQLERRVPAMSTAHPISMTCWTSR
jgi:type IV secretory pathway VirB4 component